MTTTLERNVGSPDQKTIQSFFDSIPERYDFLNSFLSLRLDRYWRKRLITLALSGKPKSILDIGVGTGTSLDSFLKSQNFNLAVGCDFSQGMLKVAKERFGNLSLIGADLHSLPFADESFDLVTSSFVLRSVKQMDQFLLGVKRILSPGGRFAFLDLTRPTNFYFWNLCYKPYLNIYLPLVGKMCSGNQNAYQFLSKSIQVFIDPERLKSQMESAGFKNVKIKRLTFGAATIYSGEK